MLEARALDLLALSPAYAVHAAILLAFFCATTSLLRSALMLESVFSRIIHVAVFVLTVLPAFVVTGVLVYAAWRYPSRSWSNLGIAAEAYVAWYLGGLLTRLVRPDADGDQARWIALGACLTFPAGIIAAMAFG